MAESKLQREFRERDVQRMRNLITKDYGAKTGVQIGYTKENIERKEGDVWEENHKTWTIKNGIKQTVSKLDSVKKMYKNLSDLIQINNENENLNFQDI
jgi:uncharacterized protein (UPF0128 family)